MEREARAEILGQRTEMTCSGFAADILKGFIFESSVSHTLSSRIENE